MTDGNRKVVVLDLDDTLYYEADYVNSGVSHVCQVLRNTLADLGVNDSIVGELLNSVKIDPKLDWLSELTSIPALSNSRDSLLWLYRLHYPKIFLDFATETTLNQLRQIYPLFILTDGRLLTQTLKLHALNLQQIPALISEAAGGEKPDPQRFISIMSKFSGDWQFVYIGDNITKDFLAPNNLGWLTIGLTPNERMIKRPIDHNMLSDLHYPDKWVANFSDLNNLLLA